MKISINLKRKSKNRTLNTQDKYFQSIDDIILFNWLKCVEGQIQYARIEVKNDIVNENDVKNWELIYDTYIKSEGLNPFYKRYLKTQVSIANCRIDYILTGNKMNFTFIELYETELKEIESKMQDGVSSETILNALSKMQGYNINTKEITAKRYFSLIKDYERSN